MIEASPLIRPELAGSVYAFGPFRLSAAERRLERDGVALKLGARGLDILALLVEHAGEPVSKELLASRVWPGVIVGDGSLRFQIVRLRRALGADAERERFIATLPGRGYCFVAPVIRLTEQRAPALAGGRQGRLPPRLPRMLGRDQALAEVRTLLERNGFVSIVGPGGIGKTTLATAVAHASGGPEEAYFVDLGLIPDAGLVSAAMAAALGLPVSETDPTTGIVAFLEDRQGLILLDSCEHVIAAAADLAEQVFRGAPGIRVIATSREALRVQWETVYLLEPFECPQEEASLTIEELLAYPAAQLFLERAAAAGARLDLVAEDAPVITDICRRLDGIALAIELAAGRVPAYGLRGTSAQLRDRLRFLQHGRRTAAPRHQTLANTLAWSCNLLDRRARRVLRRLAVFAGAFSLEAACAVVTDDDISPADATETIANLVAKSLVSTRRTGGVLAYRLLDTMRAFLLEDPIDQGESNAVEWRRAKYFHALIARHENQALMGEGEADSGGLVANLRAALEWCFGPDGDLDLGTELAAGAAPLYLRFSLLSECHRISESAIAVLGGDARESRREMALQTCLGVSLMFTSGHPLTAEIALERALGLAVQLGEPRRQLRILGELHIFHMRTAGFTKALQVAQQALIVAECIGDEASFSTGHQLLGIVLHIVGRNEEAHAHLMEGFGRSGPGRRRQPVGRAGGEPDEFSFNLRNRSRIVLARVLWIRGLPDQAAACAHDTIAEGASLGDTIGYANLLAGGASVFLWRRDLSAAETYVSQLIGHAERYSLRPARAIGAGFQGAIAIANGQAEDGVEAIRLALTELHAARYEIATTDLLLVVAEGLAMLGRPALALERIEECERRLWRKGDNLNLPELLRLKAVILADLPGEVSRAEQQFCEAIACAREQAALSWELRSAVSLGEWLAGRDRRQEATQLLEPILARFVEGLETPDFTSARHLLERCR